MPRVSDVEIFEAALRAGFTPDQAVTMTAIALAESGGETTALNPTGEYSVGLWQINTAVHEGFDPIAAQDPVINAQMAYKVSGGGADITRWTVTHEISGARYLRFRDRAEAAAAAAGHSGARGNWDPPRDYHERGAGAAPDDSDSRALFEPGEDWTTSGIATTAVGQDPEAAPVNAFDRDADGIFDRIEAYIGEDLMPSDEAPGAAASASFAASASSAPVDTSMLLNGQIPESALTEISGGHDHLLSGRPAISWEAMVAAAAADGVDITFSDAYRPLHDQQRLADELGLYNQGGLAAVPGTSNHGLGLAVDVNQDPAAMAWLDQHAAEYGWFAEVPREPWHFEYEENRDPNPDRPSLGAATGLEDGASAAGVGTATVPTAFDRDADGVFDRIEAYVEGEDFDPANFGRPSGPRGVQPPPPAGDNGAERADPPPHDHTDAPPPDHADDPLDHTDDGPVGGGVPDAGATPHPEPESPSGDGPPPDDHHDHPDHHGHDLVTPDGHIEMDDRDWSELANRLAELELHFDGDSVVHFGDDVERATLKDALSRFLEHRSVDTDQFSDQFDDLMAELGEGASGVDLDTIFDTFDFG